MRIVKFDYKGRSAVGAVENGSVKVLGGWNSVPSATTPFHLPACTPAELASLLADSRETLELADVDLAAPASEASRIICLGLNYRAHASEADVPVPDFPAVFLKASSALTGSGRRLEKPRVSEQFDYEGEIAVVIGDGGRHIKKEDAMQHVFGYSIMLDGSVRDYQQHSVTAGKNFDCSGALGPWVVTADDVRDPSALLLESRLNGELVQSTYANLMIYDIPTAISYISQWMHLKPGDVIATGTPAGVGAMRSPPLWMKSEDVIEISVSDIGVLSNTVGDEVLLSH